MPTACMQETQRRSHLEQCVYTEGMPGEWLWGSRSRYSEHDIYNQELLGDSSQRWHVLPAASTQPAKTMPEQFKTTQPEPDQVHPSKSHIQATVFTEATPAAASMVKYGVPYFQTEPETAWKTRGLASLKQSGKRAFISADKQHASQSHRHLAWKYCQNCISSA